MEGFRKAWAFLRRDLLGGHPKAAINGQLKTGHFG